MCTLDDIDMIEYYHSLNEGCRWVVMLRDDVLVGGYVATLGGQPVHVFGKELLHTSQSDALNHAREFQHNCFLEVVAFHGKQRKGSAVFE